MRSAISPRLALVFISVFVAVPVQAQQDADGSASQPLVQATPNSDSMNLNEALTRLGRNPRDIQALIDAGQAALTIGDVDAAVGFFSRADQVSPGNAQVKTGLARALVRNGNPFDAIPLFEEAERIGPIDSTAALDRGLAYDLVADNASAQRYYRQALTAGPNDEATRRLAISLAISGDKRGASTTLSPLLTHQDMAAWRARAFSLAILGQADEAISVVNGTLPPALAAGIAPYLRYMPRLTPAQQAAAANFGQFPRASEIGQDDPRVAHYATTGARRTALASSDAGLIPKGEPLGRNKRGRDERNASRDTLASSVSERPAAIAPAGLAMATGIPDPKTRRVYDTSGFPAYVPPAPVAQPRPNPPLAATPVPAARVVLPPAPPVAVRPVVAPTASAPAVWPPAALPTVQPAPASRPIVAMANVSSPTPQARTPAPAAASSPVVAAPPPVAVVPQRPPVAVAPIVRTPPAAPTAPVPPVPRRQSLSEAFSDLAKPTADIAPASGAVDIRRIRPTREVAPGLAAELPKVPSHPSRIWVQLATGRDKAALGYDWRRMTREAETVFKGKHPLVSSWGQTNRLLTGPFESEAAANSFVAQLRRGDIEGAFVWTSPAGQVVDALPGR